MATGSAIVLLGFYRVFRQETSAALRSSGPSGTFDPVGWALSGFTLVVIALLVAWAASVLGRDVRARIGAVAGAVRDAVGHRAPVGRAGIRLGGVLAVLISLGVALPIFGDMVNFDPDSHMRQGSQPGVALFGGDQGGGAGSGPSATPGSDQPGVSRDLAPGPVPGSYVTVGAIDGARPWLAHIPSGSGRMVSVNLPAPWVDGLTSFATIEIYLPPGYDSGTERYPVIYEPHQPLAAWESGVQIGALLDSVIRSGAFPAEIVVFVGQSGGPYPDSECADSYDGREWFDRYLSLAVPGYIDANYRTIATVAARSLLGFSSGGYCAAAGVTHHPDVFGTALIFSGYFEAGIKTSTTPTAGRPFNDDLALEAKASPILAVGRLTAAERSALFLAFAADTSNLFYGNQIAAFTGVLQANAVAYAVLPSPLGHSWAAVREQLPDFLALLAARQVRMGVFGQSAP
jgi:enterochelin esterase-like enzyme